ncbi:hypothetical protein QUW02_11460 [Bacteroides eggerthii]|uniref:Cytochrome c domain-containing protein n=1 Tax=Bacteroides eggerthii TaxID=28111 RepID=A0ABT7U8F1_9BACE|nr:hypothetical protein [Bacteroides eggerthii]
MNMKHDSEISSRNIIRRFWKTSVAVSRIRKTSAAVLSVLCFTACDSGDIIPKEDTGNKEIVATVSFTHVETIPAVRERKLAFMSYTNPGDEQPNRMHVITTAQEGAPTELSLTQVPDDTRQVVLALVDQDNQIIYPFFEKEISSSSDRVDLGAVTVNLIAYDRVQKQLFNQSCLDCHSGGNLSRGLNLGEGQSYRAIVNVESKVPGMPIVKPGDVESSLIVKQLTDYNTGSFHTTLTTMKDNDITLLKEWIRNGASVN